MEKKLATEREDVLEWIRLEYALAAGFQLPADLCDRCLHMCFSYFSNLESLEELLALPQHPCAHHLTAITILNVGLHGPDDLRAVIGEDLAAYGWNLAPGVDKPLRFRPDSPTIH